MLSYRWWSGKASVVRRKWGIDKFQQGKCWNVLLGFHLSTNQLKGTGDILLLCVISAVFKSRVLLCLCLGSDVWDSMARFSVPGVFNYSMLTLSDNERTLYVGAREALFALDPNDISRQLRTQVTHRKRARLPCKCFISTTEGKRT